MLPFLKRKDSSIAGTIIKTRTPDEPSESEQPDDPSASHEACARDLLKAIEAKDVKGIADALYDAFTVMESEPHEEGPHVEPHSYDAQNAKAAQDQEE